MYGGWCQFKSALLYRKAWENVFAKADGMIVSSYSKETLGLQKEGPDLEYMAV